MRRQSTSHRPERVASVIKRAVSVIVESELDDPRIKGVTVVDATVARDLRNATVWVDIEGEDIEALKALKSSAGYVRRLLCESISEMRSVPQIHFEMDRTRANYERIESVIKELHSGEKCDDGRDNRGD